MDEDTQSMNDALTQVRLRQLWKGTLLVGVAGSYLLMLSLMFVYLGWRTALLALFFVGLGQFFRYIANDVDRVGWQLRDDVEGDATVSTVQYQSRLMLLMVILIQLINLALIYQGQSQAGFRWALFISGTAGLR